MVRVQRDGEGLSFAVEFVQLTPELQVQVDELTRLGKPQPPPLPGTGAAGPAGRVPPPLPK